MGIDELKRWHWGIIGAIAGLLLGYAWTSLGSDASPSSIRRIDQLDFERILTLRDEKSGKPFVTDIVVNPPEESFDGPVTVVNFKRLARDKQQRTGWLDEQMIAKVPFVPRIPGRVEHIDQNLTVQKYLASVKNELDAPISFQSAWWMIPRNGMMLGIVAGVLVIGGIWPTLLGVMVGAGIGPKKREPKLKDRKLPRLSFFKRADVPKPGAAQPSGAGTMAATQSVADAYEQNLAAVATASRATSDSQDPSEAPVRKLEAGPVESAAPIKADDDEVEVKNKEFYPVLIHHHKHKDQPPAVEEHSKHS